MYPEQDVADVLDFVDLDIAYSPVIPYPGGGPCEAQKMAGGCYLVIHDSSRPAQSAEKVFEGDLRVMRARYLVYEGRRKEAALRSWLKDRGATDGDTHN